MAKAVSRAPSVRRCVGHRGGRRRRRREALSRPCSTSSRDSEGLSTGEYDPIALDEYFGTRPTLVAKRLGEVALAGLRGAAAAATLPKARQTRAFRDIVENLGPAFMKIAQTLSTRPDLIGQDLAAELGSLQDRAKPFSNRTALRIIEEDLGCPPLKIFEDIEDDPVAAASFGQVYKARLRPSADPSRSSAASRGYVAVKVQRPRALESIAVDVYILRAALHLVKLAAGMTRDLRLIADEIGAGLYSELDYEQEAANALVFAEAHESLDYVVVPRPIEGLTTRRILVTEWVDGQSPASLFEDLRGGGSGTAAGAKLKDLVNMGVACSLNQLLSTGVMHADPHPGNLLFTREGKLAYVDFGLLTRVAQRHRYGMLSSILHMSTGDWQGFVEDLDQLELLKPSVRKQDLVRDLEATMGTSSITNFKKLLKVMASLGVKYKFTLPPFYVLVVRSLATLEGIALQVDADFKIVSAAVPQALLVLLDLHTIPKDLVRGFFTKREVVARVVDVLEKEKRRSRRRKILSVFGRASLALKTNPLALARFWRISIQTVALRSFANIKAWLTSLFGGVTRRAVVVETYKAHRPS